MKRERSPGDPWRFLRFSLAFWTVVSLGVVLFTILGCLVFLLSGSPTLGLIVAGVVVVPTFSVLAWHLLSPAYWD